MHNRDDEMMSMLMLCDIEQLALAFQTRLLAQDGVNLINRDVLATIANCAEVECINRMAPVAEKEFCYD